MRKHNWIETQLWKGNFNRMFSTTSATSYIRPIEREKRTYFHVISFFRIEWSSFVKKNILSTLLCQRKWAHKTAIRQFLLVYIKGWKMIDDSCAFSNAISLIVFLITGKLLVKFYQDVFCFFKIWFWIGQYDPFHTIIDKEIERIR